MLKAYFKPDAIKKRIHEIDLVDLVKRFDLVVLDSSPLMSVSDACNLAPLAEETVFVIQWGKTGREVVKLA